MPITFLEEKENPVSRYLTLDDDIPSATDLSWQTDCYIAGKYSRELQKNGVFDAVLQSLLNEAAIAGRQQETLAFLEQMIGQNEAFWSIQEGSEPILVYKGDSICHNILNIFAEQFGLALEHAGKKSSTLTAKKNL